jgi:hypothetical protein
VGRRPTRIMMSGFQFTYPFKVLPIMVTARPKLYTM